MQGKPWQPNMRSFTSTRLTMQKCPNSACIARRMCTGIVTTSQPTRGNAMWATITGLSVWAPASSCSQLMGCISTEGRQMKTALWERKPSLSLIQNAWVWHSRHIVTLLQILQQKSRPPCSTSTDMLLYIQKDLVPKCLWSKSVQ